MTNEKEIQDLKAEIASTKTEISDRIEENVNLSLRIKNNLAMNKVDEKIIALKEHAISLLGALDHAV